MVIGKQIDTSKLYRYQIPYIDNETHIAIDSIISYATAQVPRSEVYPHDSSDNARILAKDIEKAQHAHSDKFALDRIFEESTWNLLVKRVGIIKLSYDPNYGKYGEIIPKSLDPDWVIVDKNVRVGENPQWICELHKESVEDLIRRFPNKKDDIYRVCGIKKGTVKQRTSEVVWREVWATVYEKGEPKEVVFCYMQDVMLAQFKDPNWFHNPGGKLENFLDTPMKPYVPINYLNDGSHWIDQTTPVEQAYSMQDVLNKRGRQIMENADTANGFLVMSADGVTNDDAENLTGDPNQKIIIATQGRPITDFVMQIPPHILPDFVLDDKIDDRSTLHSLMGTPAQFSGTNQSEAGKDQTLGEALMIKNQATSRQDRLVRCVERAARTYFNLLTQMMAVYYTDKHWFVYNGNDGGFDRIAITREMIHKDMEIGVRAGTTLPFDKSRQEAVAMNLAKMGMISPLDLFKDLHMDNPQERYDNWVKWKTSPQDLVREADSQQEDHEAYVAFVELMAGKKVEEPKNAGVPYVLSLRKLMITDEFLKAKRKIQNNVLDFVEKVIKRVELRQQLDQLSAQGPEGLDPNLNPMQPPAPQQQQAPVGLPGASPSPTLGGASMVPPMPGSSMGGMPMQPPAPQLTIAGVMGGQPPQGLPAPMPSPEAPPNINLSNPMNMGTV
jgi:hypothetical protein